MNDNETMTDNTPDTVTEQNKEKNENNYTIANVLLMVMTTILILVTVVSMVLFRTRVNENMQNTEADYRDYDRYYSFIVGDRSDSFWSAVYGGMHEEGEFTNAYIDRAGADLAAEYDKYQLMEIAIASGADGIIYEADDSEASLDLINKANASGIPVVTVRTDAPGSSRKSFVGISFYNLGTEYGKLILTASQEIASKRTDDEAGEIRVLVLTDENIQDTSQNVVLTAMKERVDKKGDSYPDIIIETETIDNSGEFTAEESVRSVFQDPDLPDIIVCLNEINTVSAYQMIVEQNRVGDALIIGYYDSDTILGAIDKQVIYATIAIDANQLGYDCVNAINEYITYKRVSEYYGVDYKIIDKKNVRKYMKGGAANE